MPQSLAKAAAVELENELRQVTEHIEELDKEHGQLFARDWNANGGVEGLFSFCATPLLSEYRVATNQAGAHRIYFVVVDFSPQLCLHHYICYYYLFSLDNVASLVDLRNMTAQEVRSSGTIDDNNLNVF